MCYQKNEGSELHQIFKKLVDSFYFADIQMPGWNVENYSQVVQTFTNCIVDFENEQKDMVDISEVQQLFSILTFPQTQEDFLVLKA